MVRHVVIGTAPQAVEVGAVDVVAVLNRSKRTIVFARADGQPATVEGDDTATIGPLVRRRIRVEGSTSVSLVATAEGAEVEVEA